MARDIEDLKDKIKLLKNNQSYNDLESLEEDYKEFKQPEQVEIKILGIEK